MERVMTCAFFERQLAAAFTRLLQRTSQSLFERSLIKCKITKAQFADCKPNSCARRLSRALLQLSIVVSYLPSGGWRATLTSRLLRPSYVRR